MDALELVTFDCAETLLKVNWAPSAFALDLAREVGLNLDEGHAASIYNRALQTRWPEYQRLNLTRDPKTCVDWWRDLTADWLTSLNAPIDSLEPLMQAADSNLYNPDRGYFEVFDDVLPTLDALASKGVRVAVISNWDYSLHRILAAWGLADRFELILASLEEGVEKPDPRLFQIALETLGVAPDRALHVGDNPVDDVQGARGVGMRAALIDRAAPISSGHVIRTLLDLVQAP